MPDVVRLADSTLAIYAVDGSGKSKSGLMVAISKDEGQTWQQGSVQFDSLVPGAADPDVVVLPDGKIRLYFVVFEDVENKTVVPTNMVKSATSSDGVNFSLESGERLKYSNLTDPDVVKIGNSWFMYFSQGAKLLAAISSNGLSFKYQKDIRSLGSVSSTVKITEETYRQFYCNNGIKSATSIDGLSWKDDAGYRLKPGTKEFICDPAPLKTEGDNWLMYYKVAKVSESKQ